MRPSTHLHSVEQRGLSTYMLFVGSDGLGLTNDEIGSNQYQLLENMNPPGNDGLVSKIRVRG